jgi:hypothetical protein
LNFEEFERAMAFVVAQQAQFAADLQHSRELFEHSRQEHDRLFAESRALGDRRYAAFTTALAGLVALIGGAGSADRRADARIRKLEESDEELRRWCDEYQR